MKREHREANGHADSFTTSRQNSIKKIFFQNLSALEGAALDAYPAINPADARSIIQNLHQRTPGYRKKPEGFLKWARKFVQKQARRHEFVASVMTSAKCRGAIVNGVKDGLSGMTVDIAVSTEDVVNEVYALIFQMAGELAKPCRVATLATRLKRLARTHAYLYFTVKRNRRHELVSEHLQQRGQLHCEYLTELELASIRAEEFDEMAA